MSNNPISPCSLKIVKESNFERYLATEEDCMNALLQIQNALDHFKDNSCRDGRLVGGCNRLLGGFGAIATILMSIMDSHNKSVPTFNKHLMENEMPVDKNNFEWE